MRLLSRSGIALLLTAIYAVIILSPLAPLAVRSAETAQAVSGGCAEECAVCGCPPEQSASKSCCCWIKKLQDYREHEHDRSAGSSKEGEAGHPVLRCASPCGGGKQLALWDANGFDLLPCRFLEIAAPLKEQTLFSLHRNAPPDGYDPPPEPPPEFAIC
jgi:hypothetical protein